VAPFDAREPQIRATWEQLLDQHPGANLFYQSPEYFNHLTKLRGDCAFLALLEQEDGTPVGIVPMRKERVLLKFDVGEYRVTQTSFSGVRILGGTLLAPQSPDVLELLFRQIARSFPDCQAMEVSGVPTASALWNFLKTSQSLRREFAVYCPYGARDCHTAHVPDSFAEYLKAFGRKKQYNLKRQIRRLQQFGDGSLELQRIDRVSAIDSFRQARMVLGGGTARDLDREVSESEALDLAARGLLFSYVLEVGGKPCAVAFGTRFRDTLVLHSFRYDKSIAHLSPGTVMHTLMMKELADEKLVRRIDYGFGEPRYRLTNDVEERVNVVIMRKTAINRSLIFTHRSYGRLVDRVKRLMGRG
jgi:CelD/BcsL family acetyltransferase involved in cellulose biosynthesis